MARKLQLRELSEEERGELTRLVRSRTAPVQRARVIQNIQEDPNLSAARAGRAAGYSSELTGPLCVNRFNRQGLAGLQDEHRPGHPRVHSEETRSKLVDLALQKPRTLGYSFELWTLERLQTAFREREDTHPVELHHLDLAGGRGAGVETPAELVP